VTTIAIVPENGTEEGTTYRAVSGSLQAVGRTPGEALDAVSRQIGGEKTTTLVIIQEPRLDRFFTAEQRERLEELVSGWRAARETGCELPADEQAELQALVDAELAAARDRAAALLAEATG
jgi:hypothetical protein